jgi:hypothetical protein
VLLSLHVEMKSLAAVLALELIVAAIVSRLLNQSFALHPQQILPQTNFDTLLD